MARRQTDRQRQVDDCLAMIERECHSDHDGMVVVSAIGVVPLIALVRIWKSELLVDTAQK